MTRPGGSATQNYINHIGFVIDRSQSMIRHRSAVVKVIDDQIAHLAQRSKDLDQETRVTVYDFSSRGTERCVVWDKDVLRMPSIAEFYEPSGMTALMDATTLALDDIALVSQKYGEHAFLLYVITDGIENNSRTPVRLFKDRLAQASTVDNLTLAVFVPDMRAKFEAQGFGFPSPNIAVWDTESSRGVEEVGATIRRATDTFMQNRAQGIRRSTSLFTQTVDTAEIKNKLVPVTPGSYQLLDVIEDSRADEFMMAHAGGKFVVGAVFYQLYKSEKVQANKDVAILTADGKLYMGRGARQMIGLPDHDTRVRPGDHTDYTILVQSTAPNRKLLAGTKAVITR